MKLRSYSWVIRNPNHNFGKYLGPNGTAVYSVDDAERFELYGDAYIVWVAYNYFMAEFGFKELIIQKVAE